MADYNQKKREIRLSIGNTPRQTDLRKANQDVSKFPTSPKNKTLRNG